METSPIFLCSSTSSNRVRRAGIRISSVSPFVINDVVCTVSFSSPVIVNLPFCEVNGLETSIICFSFIWNSSEGFEPSAIPRPRTRTHDRHDRFLIHRSAGGRGGRGGGVINPALVPREAITHFLFMGRTPRRDTPGPNKDQIVDRTTEFW